MPLLLRKLPHLRKKKTNTKSERSKEAIWMHVQKQVQYNHGTPCHVHMVVRNIARSTWRSVLLDAADEGRIRGRYPQYVIIRV